MAQLAVSAAGAAVGFAIGGPTGAQIGWTIGAAVGGALFAPKTNQQGARLANYRVTESSYGSTVPIVYGAGRVGGNNIWMSPVTEIANTTEVGKRSYLTEYRYRQSFAIALCEGPVQAVRRVWFDNRLVYSAEDELNLVSALQVGNFLEICTFYLGTDAQEVDPVIESFEGAGNVPAYKGLCYLVFDQLDLTEWGNRIPSINSEIIEYGTWSVPHLIQSIGGSSYNNFAWAGDGVEVWSSSWPAANALVGNGIVHELIDIETESGQQRGTTIYSIPGGIPIALKDNGFGVFDENWTDYSVKHTYPTSAPCINDPTICWSAVDSATNDEAWPPRGAWLIRPTDPTSDNGQSSYDAKYTLVVYTPEHLVIDMCVKLPDNRLAWIGRDSNGDGCYLRLAQMIGVDISAELSNGQLDPAGTFLIPYGTSAVNNGEGFIGMPSYGVGFNMEWISDFMLSTGGASWVGVDEVTGHLYVRFTAEAPTPRVHRFVIEEDDLEFICSYDIPYDGYPHALYVWNNQLVYATNLIDPVESYQIAQVQLEEDGSFTELGRAECVNPGNEAGVEWFVPLGSGVFMTDYARSQWTMAPRLASAGRTLDQVITKICDPVVQASDLDLDEVDDINVTGYLLERRATRRSAIEPLLSAYGVDALESLGKLKVVPRGKAEVATVLYKHLGANAESVDSDVPAETATREQTAVLPSRVDVQYAQWEASYEVGNQIAQRQQGGSEQVLSVPLPITMTAEEASRAAWRLLTEAWASRTSREWSVDMRYAALEPADPVWRENADGVAVRVRIVSKTEDDGVLRFSSVEDDGGTYVQVSTGVVGPTAPVITVAQKRVTNPVVYEVPPLNDVDAMAVTLYVAGYATDSTGWTSAPVYVSVPPSDTNLAQIGEVEQLSLGGSAVSALPDWSPVNRLQFDHAPFSAALLGGTPDEYTTDEQLEGGGLMLVGSELVSYRDATAEGNGRYSFTGLMRGRYGTDYAATGHSAGDRVLIIPDTATVEAITRNAADIGTQRLYRTVTAGRNVMSSPTVLHTLVGRTMMPLPPCHVRLYRTSTGDRVFAWTRRDRKGQAWRDGVDAPLSESTESYMVEVINADTGATLRSSTVTSASYTYTRANWEADFSYLPPETIRLRVAQVSNVVGAGEYADVTLSWAGDFFYNYNYDALLLGPNSAALPQATQYKVGSATIEQYADAGYSNQIGVNARNISGGDYKVHLTTVPSVQDFELRFTTYPTNVATTQWHGVVARTTYWRTAGDYGYGLVLRFLGGGGSACKLQLGYGTNSNAATFTQIAATGDVYAAGTYYSVVWRAVGNLHRVWVDGAIVAALTVTSAQYATTAGGVGLTGNHSIAGAFYHDISVRY